MSLVPPRVDLDPETARFIAAGLRALAGVDGSHDAELALVTEFEQGEAADPASFDLAGDHPLKTPELRDLFLRSALLLALADGRVSEGERERLTAWAGSLGVDPVALAYLDRDVRKSLLGGLTGVEVFRDQAVAIGRDLGLDDSDIEDALGPTPG